MARCGGMQRRARFKGAWRPGVVVVCLLDVLVTSQPDIGSGSRVVVNESG